MKNTSLEAYVKQFRGEYKNSVTKEVVKDTKTIFELKITDCICVLVQKQWNM